jgi:ubiquinone/menaquinone biosynthesis C-methylase UbiE
MEIFMESLTLAKQKLVEKTSMQLNCYTTKNTDMSAIPPPAGSARSSTHYDQYLGPIYFEPYAIEVANRIDPSSVNVALELAAGTGRVTRHLRRVLSPETILIASDLSEDMLAVAKEKLENESIGWQIINAQELPFGDNSIDLVVCCFGFMFVEDRSKAFAEALRVLRPGGMLIFSTWDKLEANGPSFVYRTIVEKYLGEPLPASFNLASSMHDESSIKSLLEEAGFSKIVVEKVSKQSSGCSAKDAATGLTMAGSIYNEIMKRKPEQIDALRTEVEKELAEKYGSAVMIAPISAVISQAWK